MLVRVWRAWTQATKGEQGLCICTGVADSNSLTASQQKHYTVSMICCRSKAILHLECLLVSMRVCNSTGGYANHLDLAQLFVLWSEVMPPSRDTVSLRMQHVGEYAAQLITSHLQPPHACFAIQQSMLETTNNMLLCIRQCSLNRPEFRLDLSHHTTTICHAMQARAIQPLTAYAACSLGCYSESAYNEWSKWGLKRLEVILGSLAWRVQ